MGDKFVIDIFDLCWNAVLAESFRCNLATFNAEHCKILDSRDTNFDKIENRLAYTYRYGCFNIEYFEKCLSNFLSEYSELETVFPLENLKVCSLSNGPGFDIIALLCALCKTKKKLKSSPQLKAINLYDSWRNMYQTIIRNAHLGIISLKGSYDFYYTPTDNIHFIQSDIYSTMKPEAEEFIRDCNVLFMVKVFISTKATTPIFTDTFKRIFLLLKPGTLIFFVGSKNNIKKFNEDSSLCNSVKCIYGPQKVSLPNLSMKLVPRIPDVIPQGSGHAFFIVWQRRALDATKEIMKIKKKGTRRKRKTKTAVQAVEKEHNGSDDISSFSELLHDTDAESEISATSSTKQSISLSDECRSDSMSLTVVSNESNGNSNIESQNISETGIRKWYPSINTITTRFNEIHIKDFKERESDAQQNLRHLTSGSSNLLETFNCVKGPELNKIDSQPLEEINLLEATSTEKLTTEAIKNEASMKDEIQHIKEDNFASKINLIYQINSQSLKEMNFLETHLKETKIAEATENVISKRDKFQHTKEYSFNDKMNFNCLNSEVNLACKIVNPTDGKNEVIRNVSALNKTVVKNKIKSPEVTSSKIDSQKKDKKPLKSKVQNNSALVNQSFESILKDTTDIQNSSGKNKNDIQELTQRFKGLVTSLEILTDKIKNDIINSRNNHSVVNKNCCDCRSVHCCICSAIAMHLHCKKSCSCTTRNASGNSHVHNCNI